MRLVRPARHKDDVVTLAPLVDFRDPSVWRGNVGYSCADDGVRLGLHGPADVVGPAETIAEYCERLRYKKI